MTRMLECLLDEKSEVEIVQRQKDVNARRGRIGAKIEDKEKEIRAKHRRELADALGPLRAEKLKLDKELQELVDQLSDGTVSRPVECEERTDYETGIISVIRLDTRDPVERRPLSGDERQLELEASP